MKPRWFLAAGLVTSACNAFVPQGGMGDVYGRVISLRPPRMLGGITVLAKQAVVETVTDREGQFLLKDLPTTWQDIHVTVEGYRPLVRRIKVEPFGGKYVEFYLQPPTEPEPAPEFLFERDGSVWRSDRLGLRQTQLTRSDRWQFRQPIWGPDHHSWAAIALDVSPRAAEPPGIWFSDGDAGPVRVASLPAAPLGLTWRGGPFLVTMDSPGLNQGMGRGTMLALVSRGKPLRFISPGNGEGLPNLSPDSRYIAYTVYTGTPSEYLGMSRQLQGRTEIMVANAAGANARELTREGDNFDPAWSPDGKQLAFISNRDGGAELWVMKADGSDQRRLTWTGAKRAANPVWAPDGKAVAYNTSYKDSHPGRRPTALWRVDLRSGEMAMVSNDASTASW